MKAMTDLEIEKIIKDFGYFLVDADFVGRKKYITFKDCENYYYYSTPYILKLNFLRNCFPSKFHKSNKYSILNIRNWLSLNSPHLNLISDKYNSIKEKLIFKDIVGYFYYLSFDNLLRKNSIPSKFGNGNPYTVQNINLWCKLNDKPFELISEKYKEAHLNLKWKCLICDKPFKSTWGHIYNGRGCGNCSNSIGETRIENWLHINNIKFKKHKTFKKLLGLGNGNLSYDFYLPKYNLLIEYQGRQHELINTCWNQTEKDLEKQQEHDRRKREYAQNNNINLLEIWYKDLNRVENILNTYIKGGE